MSWTEHPTDRKATLPSNWASIRKAVLERDGGQCTWRDAGVRCPHSATDVDHIRGRDDHRLTNLRALCRWHHNRVTAQQGNAARRPISEKRPKAKHPGLL